MHTTLRRAATPLAAAALAAGAIALGAAPASAHAEMTPSTTVAGEYAVLTFSIGHGCDGSATTDVAIDIPEGIDVVTPTINQGWTIAKQTEPIPNVDASDPDAITERTTRVTYAAKTPLADGYRDTFELAVPLPDKAGETLTFPTIQTCEKGETAWTQVPEEGQSEEELETPAPAMELTAADEVSDVSEAGHAESDTASTAAAPGDAGSDETTGLSWT
ncbi:MAG: YcnI family protein, partial [Nocardioidaceae bacterium]